jgi:chemosensory pili system protein ChpA (sensor histidine kinase/response regulator)
MRPEKRILVVDDDDAIRALVVTVLRRRGYAVDAARNGVDAMDMMQAHRYTLVVLDLMMPRMSGYELVEQLMTHSIMTRPRVLILTAGIPVGSFDTSLVIGMMHKPFDVELLLDTVAGCLHTIERMGPEESTSLVEPAVTPTSQLN